MRVAIVGAKGQLGHDLIRALSEWELIPLNHADLDVCDFQRVRDKLTDIKPRAVINTAAFHRVDDCEDEVEKAFLVNAYAPRHLAQVCADLECTLVHISTDYVFDGKKNAAYSEEDTPNPLSVYGNSKLAGEYFVRAICPKHLVVRTSGLYGIAGSSGKGGNFVETMIRLAREGKPIRVVNDQVLTPTHTKDLAQTLRQLIKIDRSGLYHVTNGGQCSWYDFAGKIFELLGSKPDFGPTTTASYKLKAMRPACSVLAHRQLERTGLDGPPHWHDALRAYLSEKKYI